MMCWILPAQAQTVTFHVSGGDETLRMETIWLGERREVPLHINQQEAVGELEGAAVRFLPVELYLERNGTETLIFQELVSLSQGDQNVFFQVSRFQESARQQAGKGNETNRKYIESSQVVGFIGWFVLVFSVVHRLQHRSFSGTWEPQWKWFYSPLFWLIFAVLWTWPA